MTPLPIDCEAYYVASFLSRAEADALFEEILVGFDVTDGRVRMCDGTEFRNEIGGYIFADPELTSFAALPEVWGGRCAWTDSLIRVRDRITELTGITFQVARCAYYKNGSVGSDFHCDLPAYGSTSAIASLSLGAEREFAFRSNSDVTDYFSLQLSPGSLLFMGKGCQERYQHALLRDKRWKAPRLNLTFRKYGWE